MADPKPVLRLSPALVSMTDADAAEVLRAGAFVQQALAKLLAEPGEPVPH